MTKPRPLLLPLALGGALLVLAALASLMWFRFARPAGGERAVAVPAPAASRADTPESTAVLDTPRVQSEDANDAALPASAAPDTASRDAAEVVTGREIDGAIWIRGRVVLPPGTALDETMEVIATGRKWRDRADHRARVERDGTFLAAFAKQTRNGKLKLDAQHLYLDDPVAVDLREPPAIVELTPKLGARVRGRLVAQPGAEALATELVGQKVTWSPAIWEPGGEATIAPDLSFEFRGVLPDKELSLSLDANAVEKLDHTLPALPPGGDHEVELVFRAGGRVRGRIVDEAGAPIRNVFVGVGPEEENSWSRRKSKSDESGVFDVRGIKPGIVVATAHSEGYELAMLELGALADGDKREHVELVLKRGNSLTGTVRWPDGTPAAGAVVRAFANDNTEPFSVNEQDTRCGADGTFVLGNLPEGTLTVRAQLRTRNPKAAAKDSANVPASSEKELARPTVVHARADGVRHGEVVNLVLRSGASVSGRVLDDRGKPVTRFRVLASPSGESFPHMAQDGRNRFIRDEEGRFTLDGLSEGSWLVHFVASRHRNSAEVPVEVGSDVAIPDVTMLRAGIVKGTVAGTDGAPLSDVEVRVLRPEAKPAFEFEIFGESDSSVDGEDKTDSKGRFTLEVDPGVALQLVATGAQRSDSAPHDFVVAAGEELAGIVLVLADPGAISGRFIARRGESAADRAVTASLEAAHQYEELETHTDASGGFRFERVPAGTYTIAVAPAGPEPSWDQMLERERWDSATETAEVVVVSGATSDVVVGRVARAPVAVSGRVSRGARGLADVAVTARKRGNERLALARTDSAGRYAVELDEPGTYTFTLSSPAVSGGGQTLVLGFGSGALNSGTELSKEIVVPEAAAQTIDFELPSGRIRGRVLGEKAKPLANIGVRLVVESVKSSEGVVPNSGSCSTDAEGRFAFESLPAGTFGLETDPSYTYGVRPQVLAPARVSGLVIEGDGSIDGVELRLEQAGAIEVRVLASDGTTVDDAEIVLRDARGVRVSADDVWPYGGRYQVSSVAPGRYSITATRGAEIAPEPVSLEIVSGRTEKVELQLVRGTVLEIIARDAAGELVASSFSVRDSSGADHAELHPSEDSASNEVGPLARGTYTVVVEAGGKRAERSVAVTGQERMVVELRYEP